MNQHRMMKLLVLAGAMVLPIQRNVWATAPYYVQISGHAGASVAGLNDVNDFDSGQVIGTWVGSPGPVSASVGDILGNSASAESGASIAVGGHFHAWSSASADALINPPGGANGFATAELSDTLTITSPSLLPGTPVSLTLTLKVHSVIDGSGDALETIDPAIQGNLSLNGGGSGFQRLFNPLESVHDDVFVGGGTVFVGDTVSVDIVLTALSYVSITDFATGFDGADATATFSADILTPGASYTTASGLTYFSAVPEPSIVVLLGLGGLLLRGGARRKLTGPGGKP